MIPFSQDMAVVGVAKLTAIASVIVSLEYLTHASILRDGGLMGWAVGRLRYRWHVAGVRGQALDAVLGYPRVLVLLYLRLAVGCFIVLGPTQLVLSAWATAPAALLSLLFWLRTDYGHDGADQMIWISFAGLALLSMAPTGVSAEAFLWFVALMACHAYVTAGLAKVGAKRWRDGSFLPEILGTRIYGNESVGRFLLKRPGYRGSPPCR